MRTIGFLIAASLLSAAAIAQSPPPSGSNEAQLEQQVQQQLTQMQQLMARMHATNDPQEHRDLMQQHLQSLEHGMLTMNSMMQRPAMMHGGAQPDAAQCQQGDAQCKMQELEAERSMMGERMAMMQGMMAQMMAQMAAMRQNMGNRSTTETPKEQPKGGNGDGASPH